MAADGSINIDTSINTKPVTEGVNTVEKELKGLKDSANKTSSSASASFEKMAKAAVVFTAISKAVKSTAAVVKDLTSTYKVQAAAETKLQSAAKNNPYINGESVSNLKQFASEVQSVTTYGDEQLLPLMAQLVSTGRTEKEVMDIIKASVDVAASGTMSLDSAVQQLNATYSGNVGQLGRQISELKDLTEEDLKNGKAVEIIEKNYKGMAEQVAKTTGQADQLNNAFGDLKEVLGASLNSSLAPFEAHLTKIITKITNALAEAQRLKNWGNTVTDALNGNADYETTKFDLEKIQKNYDEQTALIEKLKEYQNMTAKEKSSKAGKSLSKELKKTIDAYATPGGSNDDAINSAIQSLTENNTQLEEEISRLQTNLKNMQEAQEGTAESAGDAAGSADDKAKSALETYNAEIAQMKKQIELKKEMGSYTSDEEALQEELNARESAYINLIINSEGTISGASEREQKELKKILDLRQQLSDPASWQELADALSEITEPENEIDALKNQLQALKDLLSAATADGLDENTDLYKEYLKKIEILNKEIADAEAEALKEASDKQKEELQQMMENIKETLSEINEISSNLTDLAETNIESVQSADLANAQLQYEQGVISYEDYCEKIEAINKEAAEKLYRVQLAEWVLNLAAATANIATGITNALKDGTTATAIINSGLIAAAGAVQIAQLMASKPSPPSFATGGIVGGTSYTGDQVRANVNSGEMILNSAQQLALWKAANGGASGGMNQEIIINNSMSDKANVTASITDGQIRIAIKEVMKQELNKGTFNKQIAAATTAVKGSRYL